MARRTHHGIGKQKRYGVQIRFRSDASWFSKRFLDEWDDDEREDVIGQPNDKAEGK